MNKIFSAKKMNDFLEYISKLGVSGDYNEISSKEIMKKVNKKLEDISCIEYLYEALTASEKKDLIERFFPLKSATVFSSPYYKTEKFYYSPEDEKIHWMVVFEENGNNVEKHYKLRTDNFLNRTIFERANASENIKRKFDKCFGYFLYEGNGMRYVTDCNKANGQYRKISDLNDDWVTV